MKSISTAMRLSIAAALVGVLAFAEPAPAEAAHGGGGGFHGGGVHRGGGPWAGLLGGAFRGGGIRAGEGRGGPLSSPMRAGSPNFLARLSPPTLLCAGP